MTPEELFVALLHLGLARGAGEDTLEVESYRFDLDDWESFARALGLRVKRVLVRPLDQNRVLVNIWFEKVQNESPSTKPSKNSM